MAKLSREIERAREEARAQSEEQQKPVERTSDLVITTEDISKQKSSTSPMKEASIQTQALLQSHVETNE